MKGVSPIIAVIMLLFITITIGAFVSLSIDDIARRNTVDTKEASEQFTERSLKTLTYTSSKKSGDDITVTVRNVGFLKIEKDEWSLFLDDKTKNCPAIEPEQIGSCTIENVTCEDDVIVNYPNGSFKIRCTFIK